MSPRILKAHRDSLNTALTTHTGITWPAAVVDQLILAVLTATDEKAQHIVLTVEPSGQHHAWGPYGSADAARNAAVSGWCATQEGARGTVLPLIPAPRNSKTLNKYTQQQLGA